MTLIIKLSRDRALKRKVSTNEINKHLISFDAKKNDFSTVTEIDVRE